MLLGSLNIPLISLEVPNIFQQNFSMLKYTFVAFNSYKKILVTLTLNIRLVNFMQISPFDHNFYQNSQNYV